MLLGHLSEIHPAMWAVYNTITDEVLCSVWTLSCTGVLLDKTDSWSVIFGAVAIVYALGFAGFAAWGSGELQNYDE